MTKKSGLGKGLAALIPQKNNRQRNALKSNQDYSIGQERLIDIPISKISANPYQPREIFDHASLEELTNSIKEHGILQPLIVTRKKDGNYELIAGERRFRAAQIINMKTVPVVVRSASDLEKLELSLIENIQRKDLNPIERAEAYKRLIDEFSLTQDELAKKMGKTRPHVANTIRFLSLPGEVQNALSSNKLSEGHAKVILGLRDKDQQIKYYKRVLHGNLTVRELENEVKRVKVNGYSRKSYQDPNLVPIIKKLEEIFGTKVKVFKKGKTGKIIIEFYSQEELNSIIRKISRN